MFHPLPHMTLSSCLHINGVLNLSHECTQSSISHIIVWNNVYLWYKSFYWLEFSEDCIISSILGVQACSQTFSFLRGETNSTQVGNSSSYYCSETFLDCLGVIYFNISTNMQWAKCLFSNIQLICRTLNSSHYH